MPIRFVLIMIFALTSLSVFSDALDDKLRLCEQHLDDAHCVGVVLLEAIRLYKPSGGSVNKPRCRCMAGGLGENVTTLYFFDGEDSMVLANGLKPLECVQAFNYSPCRP